MGLGVLVTTANLQYVFLELFIIISQITTAAGE